mmetsp:Transcript_9272/g.22763  ORF Transcript_9272/g.22763 Transcript_9272/m.22763 type:complete len:278 (-) Transcript_9272:549-1382(-)
MLCLRWLCSWLLVLNDRLAASGAASLAHGSLPAATVGRLAVIHMGSTAFVFRLHSAVPLFLRHMSLGLPPLLLLLLLLTSIPLSGRLVVGSAAPVVIGPPPLLAPLCLLLSCGLLLLNEFLGVSVSDGLTRANHHAVDIIKLAKDRPPGLVERPFHICVKCREPAARTQPRTQRQYESPEDDQAQPDDSTSCREPGDPLSCCLGGGTVWSVGEYTLLRRRPKHQDGNNGRNAHPDETNNGRIDLITTGGRQPYFSKPQTRATTTRVLQNNTLHHFHE